MILCQVETSSVLCLRERERERERENESESESESERVGGRERRASYVYVCISSCM